MTINRWAARTDDNKAAIVTALRQAGATVYDLRRPVDLLVGYQGQTLLVEIKDGAKSPSRRKHTKAQASFLDTWTGGPVATVHDVAGALECIQTLCQNHGMASGNEPCPRPGKEYGPGIAAPAPDSPQG